MKIKNMSNGKSNHGGKKGKVSPPITATANAPTLSVVDNGASHEASWNVAGDFKWTMLQLRYSTPDGTVQFTAAGPDRSIIQSVWQESIAPNYITSFTNTQAAEFASSIVPGIYEYTLGGSYVGDVPLWSNTVVITVI